MGTDSVDSMVSILPTKRAAYSDRMAVLMTEMSRLAYVKFEIPSKTDFDEAAALARGAGDHETAVKAVRDFYDKVVTGHKTRDREALCESLKRFGFKLRRTYCKVDTQAFLATRAFGDKENRTETGIAVLCFRGTESDEIGDWKTNLNVRKTMPGGSGVHAGFWEALKVVRDEIEKDIKSYREKGYALYVTGHSLGGALALIATKEIANDSPGACYTFGQPRVSAYGFEDDLKTPVYRVVNANDIVPRVPPVLIPRVLHWVASNLPFPWAGVLKSSMRGLLYSHHGDMRYLTRSKATGPKRYADVKLRSNPPMYDRLGWMVKDFVLRQRFGSPVSDHKISTYCDKLRAYAESRNP